MRTLKNTSIYLFLSMILCTCMPQKGPDSDPTAGSINITGQTEATGTKTTLSGVQTIWSAGSDKIGIFSPQAKPTEGGAAPTNNAAFTAQTPAKSSGFTGTMFWGEGNHHFYAYYPYKSTCSGDQSTVPISLSPAQTQSAAGNTAHIGALDFMVSTPLAVTPPGAVNFTFSHVFAMIEFQIKGSGTLTQINLIGADPLACEGTINLSQTPGTNTYAITTSSTSNFVSVTLGLTGVSLSTETAVSIYMMVLPGAQSKDMKVALKIGGNWKILDKTRPTDGFARGQKYVVSLDSDSETAGWYNSMTDSDLNVYDLVVIGGQIWMAENLKYLPAINAVNDGSNTDPKYYVYGYTPGTVEGAKAEPNYTTYGVLYNWTAARAACPEGWHLPSDAEWTQMETYLANNGYNYDGSTGFEGEGTVRDKIAKSMATDSGWKTSSNAGSIGNTDYPAYRNKSGFSVLPGGYRGLGGTFGGVGGTGYWWSFSAYDTPANAWGRYLYYFGSGVGRYGYAEGNGYSVRCVKT